VYYRAAHEVWQYQQELLIVKITCLDMLLRRIMRFGDHFEGLGTEKKIILKNTLKK
jgi:hypothetical protein